MQQMPASPKPSGAHLVWLQPVLPVGCPYQQAFPGFGLMMASCDREPTGGSVPDPLDDGSQPQTAAAARMATPVPQNVRMIVTPGRTVRSTVQAVNVGGEVRRCRAPAAARAERRGCGRSHGP